MNERYFIGGSDMAALLGIDPWRQPMDVYRGIVENEQVPINEQLSEDGAAPVYFGVAFEDAVAAAYCKRTGRTVRNHPRRAHKKFPFLTGHLDRKVEGLPMGLEIKNVGFRMAYRWGEQGSDEVSEYYLPQVHTYMCIHDYEAMDVAAIIGGQELRVYTVERNPEWDDLIEATAERFWNDHVLAETPPPVDFNHRYAPELVKRIYRGISGKRIALDDQAYQWHRVLEDAGEQASKYAKVVEGARAHLAYLMGDAAVGLLPDGTAYVRKVTNRKAFETKATSYVSMRHLKFPPEAGGSEE